jgi:hypothetical protein
MHLSAVSNPLHLDRLRRITTRFRLDPLQQEILSRHLIDSALVPAGNTVLKFERDPESVHSDQRRQAIAK